MAENTAQKAINPLIYLPVYSHLQKILNFFREVADKAEDVTLISIVQSGVKTMSVRMILALLLAFVMSCSESSFSGGSAKNGAKGAKGNPGSTDGSDGGSSTDGVGPDGSSGSVTNADGSLTETFSFTGSTKSVDILFALDTSGSMKEELSFLADKFSLFNSEIKKFGIDANTVIIYDKSDEMDKISSQFKHHRAEIFSNDALCIIKDFFGNSSAMGMLRAGVPLEVFVVTDDNAGGRKIQIPSGGGIPTLPDQNECKEQAFQPPADKKTSFSGIIGLTKGKNTDTCNISAVGEEYKIMAPKYGGNIYDLCTQDWAALVKDMADDLGQRIRKFKLKDVPNLSKGITVMLNGAVLQASDYTYDAASNTITISSSVISSANDKVEVKYFPQK